MKKSIQRMFRSAVVLSLAVGQFFSCPAPVSKAAMYDLNNPVTNSCGGTTWNSLYFGNYYQSDTTGKKKEPIQWRVLEIRGVDAYLIADKNLDTHVYHRDATNTTWENSDIRKWLNEDFLNAAFTKQEQQAIISTTVDNENNPYFHTAGGSQTTDKVLLPSLSDMQNATYGFSTEFRKKNNARKAQNTAYLAAKQGMHPVTKGDCYWLRTPGYLSTHATRMNENGYGDIYGMSVNTIRYAVRPVIHLDLGYYKYWSRGSDIVSADDVVSKQHKSSTKVKSIKKPKKTSITSITINRDQTRVKIRYKKIAKVSGYEIEYAFNRKFKKAKTLDTDRSYAYIKKFKTNKKYYVRVRSYRTNSDGSVTKYSKWSKKKIIYVEED